MQYMGGKSRIAKQIAAVIDEHRQPGQLVWDAFCGGLSVSVALSKKGPVLASDACESLIVLYRAVQNGWDPPTEVSKETWESAKKLPDTDPMKAFCGFGCSFGGKWFGSYSRKDPRPGRQSQASCSKKLVLSHARAKNLTFAYIDFLSQPSDCPSAIIYADPPYKGQPGYNSVPDFDHVKFCDRIKHLSKACDVFVSEYDFSFGNVVWEREIRALMLGTSKGSNRLERLYHIAKGSLS
jgi:DNA adenine methylase